MSLVALFHFLCAQHFSYIIISIIRSLRLFCWITTLVVLFLVRCVWSFGLAGLDARSNKYKIRLQLFMCYAPKQWSSKESSSKRARTVSFHSPVHESSFVTTLKKYRPQVATLTVAVYPYLTDSRSCRHCKNGLVKSVWGVNRSLFWDHMENICTLWTKNAQIFNVSYQVVSWDGSQDPSCQYMLLM